MSDQGEQTPERDIVHVIERQIDVRESQVAQCRAELAEADAINAKAGHITNFADDPCSDCEEVTADVAILRLAQIEIVEQRSALRSAEARGRVQGLREAADFALRYYKPVGRELHKMADDVELEQPK